MLKSAFVVGLGGFIGSVLRYLTIRFVHLHTLSQFPWGTLIVNLAGSFIIGILLGIFEKYSLLSTNWNLFLTVGICGGFTTFSSFSSDAFILLKNREIIQFALYSGGSLFLGILLLFVGRTIIKMI